MSVNKSKSATVAERRTLGVICASALFALFFGVYYFFDMRTALTLAVGGGMLQVYRNVHLFFQHDDLLRQKEHLEQELRHHRNTSAGQREAADRMLFMALAAKFPYAFRGGQMVVLLPDGRKVGLPDNVALRYKCVNPSPGVGGLDVLTGPAMYEAICDNLGQRYERVPLTTLDSADGSRS
jgi:hypothetical protein